ncbi:tRNA (adenosine(37)-N6)-dimethylallyltransferase MiaA [Pelagibacteraceae bacterium]|nr:tRNA (adenosine(37)-N6)-dimethylallyltransferase MiaA [Pelagibacteraceae bacterium]
MSQRDILIIFGTTASGKSYIANKVANKNDAAIINSDSLQIYKDLHVLTDRPSEQIISRYDHRLYGILNGNNNCTAALWLDKAIEEINLCFKENILPIIVGGTGLYVKVLMEGISQIPGIKKEIKEEVDSLLKSKGIAFLYNEIKNKYNETRISFNDKQRIVRSYSLLKQTNKVLEEWQVENHNLLKDVNFKIFITENDRSVLYQRAEKRTEKMFNEGVIDEVSLLLEKNYDPDSSLMKAIGVREIRDYLENLIDLDTCKNRMKKSTRNYIKRQQTWIKGNNITSNINIKKYI